MLTPAQLRAARALLDWSRQELAERSGTSAETVQAFEARDSDPKLSTLNKWKRALEQAGVELQDEDEHGGPGVRLRKAKRK
jgi:transcriptional regulator with XRE-family HTH domain